MSLRKNDYNNNAAFVALKVGLRLGGNEYQPGDTIDTKDLSVRKKMQLFHANLIGYDYMVDKKHLNLVEKEVKEDLPDVEKSEDNPSSSNKKPNTRSSQKKSTNKKVLETKKEDKED